MDNRRPLAAAWLLAFTPWLSPAPAHAQFDDEQVELGKTLDIELLHGYPRSDANHFSPVTIGLSIHNRGPARQLRVRTSQSIEHEQILHLAAGERRRAFMYLPASARTYLWMDVELQDLRTGDLHRTTARAPVPNGMMIARLGTISSAFNVDTPWSMGGAIDDHLPDSWRGLSGVRAIAVERARYDALGSGREVLLDWVTAGGLLLLISPQVQPDQLPPVTERAFAGAAQMTATGRKQRLGHGFIFDLPAGELADVGGGFLSRIGLCDDCGWTDKTAHKDAYYFNRDFNKLLNERLPRVRARASAGLFMVLLLFSIVVGPLGWRAVVTRNRRPLRYIGFVMLSALIFSGGVLAADLSAQGLDPKGSTQRLRMIDQRHDLELGAEELAVYAPSSRGTVLQLPDSFLPVFLRPRDNWDQDPLTLTRRNDSQRIEGALEPRVPRILGARWLEPAQGRLLVSADGGQVRVESHLGENLRSLLFWRDGQPYSTGPLSNGQSAIAEAISAEQADARRPSLPAGFLLEQSRELLVALLDGELGNDRYVALVDGDAGGSTLIEDELVEVASGVRIVAGVYR